MSSTLVENNKAQQNAARAAASRDALFAAPSTTASGNNNNMQQISCDKNHTRTVYVVPPMQGYGGVPPMMMGGGGIDMWRVWCVIARLMAELVGSFFIAWAAGIRDIWVANGAGDPGPIAQNAAIVLVLLGFVYAFSPFKAGHFNPAITLIAWACETTRWQLQTIGIYLGYWLAQFIGYLLGALLTHSAIGGPALLQCTVIRPSLGNGFGFVFEFVGITALCLIYSLAVQRKGVSLITTIGLMAALFGLLITIAPASGGSLNLFRSIGPALVEGGACGNSLGIYAGALFAGVATAILMLLFIFPAKSLPRDEATALHWQKTHTNLALQQEQTTISVAPATQASTTAKDQQAKSL